MFNDVHIKRPCFLSSACNLHLIIPKLARKIDSIYHLYKYLIRILQEGTMGRYLIRRLLLLIPVTIGVVTVAFLLMHISPGDPALAYLGNRATPKAVAALHHKWGLDTPLWQQYCSFIVGLATGHLGDSLYFKTPITTLLATRIPLTLLLMFMSAIIALVISVPLAVLASLHEDGIADLIVRFLNALAQGMPQFWVGTMLIVYLSVDAGLFPVGGYGDTIGQHFWSLVLPSITVAIGITPILVKSLRSSMLDALSSQYVEYARTKGVDNHSILFKYVLRNACISGVSVFGISVGSLAGGSLIVENIFALPGMGATMMKAILTRDYPVVQVCTVIFAVIVVIVYLLTDIAYSIIDPRVRLQ